METDKDSYVYPGKRFTKCGVMSGHGQGMTLRDWFAGQALIGLTGSPHRAAEAAYEYADAMLEARSKPADGGE